MTTIDMTAQLGSLITALQVLLVVASAAVGASAWHSRKSAADTRSTGKNSRHLAIVGALPSAPAPARTGVVPSDTSVPEAA